MKQIVKKSFSDWDKQTFYKVFDVKRIKPFPLLEQWLNTTISLTVEEKTYLDNLSEYADELIESWNETELRENFILKLMDLVDFRNKSLGISHFSERYLSVIIQNKINLYGYVDWMVASGWNKPTQPYFLIHEYKSEQGGAMNKGDVRGQLFSTMYAAQALHKENKTPTLFDINQQSTSKYFQSIPIYGLYVVGRMWFFAVLQGSQIGISTGHIATKKEDLYHILQLLKAQKQHIIQTVKQQEVVLVG